VVSRGSRADLRSGRNIKARSSRRRRGRGCVSLQSRLHWTRPPRERQRGAADPVTAAYHVGRGLLRGAPTVYPIGRLAETQRAATAHRLELLETKVRYVGLLRAWGTRGRGRQRIA